ncbi:hypothetical protein [Pseudomonas sp.]|uniref:hypothetical protein n=1 Tax=Pseudomonas sp. TaxID=306 RepID=UPI003F31F2BA
MLRLTPRAPKEISTSELLRRLNAENFDSDRRTFQHKPNSREVLEHNVLAQWPKHACTVSNGKALQHADLDAAAWTQQVTATLHAQQLGIVHLSRKKGEHKVLRIQQAAYIETQTREDSNFEIDQTIHSGSHRCDPVYCDKLNANVSSQTSWRLDEPEQRLATSHGNAFAQGCWTASQLSDECSARGKTFACMSQMLVGCHQRQAEQNGIAMCAIQVKPAPHL